MNKQEYAEYQAQVAKYLEGIEAISTGPCPGCSECGIPEDAEEYHEDPWFSKNSCEICGDIAGMRESWHGLVDGKLVHGSCCETCVLMLNDLLEPEVEQPNRKKEIP